MLLTVSMIFLAHPEVHLSESSRYFKRLKCKPLNNICIIINYKQLCTVASQLQINQYKDNTVDVLRSMIIEKYNVVFARRNKETNVTAQITKTKAHFEVQ